MAHFHINHGPSFQQPAHQPASQPPLPCHQSRDSKRDDHVKNLADLSFQPTDISSDFLTPDLPHEDPFVSTYDERFAAFSSSLFTSSGRRSTPSLPPGLTSASGLAGSASRSLRLFQSEPTTTRDELPPMRGLGTEPGAPIGGVSNDLAELSWSDQTPHVQFPIPKPDNSTNQTAEPPTAVEATPTAQVFQETEAQADLDDTSFPALPPANPSKQRQPQPLAQKWSGAAVPKVKSSQSREDENKRPEIAAKAKTQVKEEPRASSTIPEPKQAQPQTSEGRKHPGKLDIEAATQSLQAQVNAADTKADDASDPVKNLEARTDTPGPSGSSTPTLAAGTPAAGTPTKRTPQPRTLRVTATPKTEASPTPATADTLSSAAQHAMQKTSRATSRQTSRRPSDASTNVAETPANETIADTASVATDSISRAGSPPPASSRVGTAPVRDKTKSQVKKDRQERAKALADEQPAKSSAQAEPVVAAPVVGRKTKKTKPKKTTPVRAQSKASTPDISQPPSPGLSNKQPKPEEPATSSKVKTDETTELSSAKDPPEASIEDILGDVQAGKAEPATPAAIIKELQDRGEVDVDISKLLSEPSYRNINNRSDAPSWEDIMNVTAPKSLTSEEVTALNRGEAVRREGPNNRTSSRLMISPSKKCLPRLTKELEDRYLEVEKRVLATDPPYRYTHQRGEAAKTLASIDDMLRDVTAILTRPPKTNRQQQTYLGQRRSSSAKKTRRSTSSSDGAKPQIQPPSQQGYASDALAYLNQFILPPLPAPPRPNPMKPQTATAMGAQTGTAGNSTAYTAATGQTAQSAPGAAIPRTYTTGDPTYSVSGVGGQPSTSVTATGPIPQSPNTQSAAANTSLDIQKLIHGNFGELTQSDIKKLRKEDIDRLSPNDISALAQNAANAAAAAVGDLRNLDLSGGARSNGTGGNLSADLRGELGALKSADFEKIQSLGSKALKGQALSSSDMASLRSLGIGGNGQGVLASGSISGGGAGAGGANASAEAIKTALANAVNGVVQAAAAVANVSDDWRERVASGSAPALMSTSTRHIANTPLSQPETNAAAAQTTGTTATAQATVPFPASHQQQVQQQARHGAQMHSVPQIQMQGQVPQMPGQVQAQVQAQRSQPTLEETRLALEEAKREAKVYEGRMGALVKKNRRGLGL